MIIDNLASLPSTITTGDELPVERGTTTYKIDYNALATAIINKLYGDAGTARASLNLNMRTYTSVTQLGLTAGSATLPGAYDAMPNGSMLIEDINNFASNQKPSSGVIGMVVIQKWSTYRGFAALYNKTSAVDYRMFEPVSGGGLDGIWYKMTWTAV